MFKIGMGIFGVIGCAILLSLGVWQIQRLAWKEGVLADIENRIAAAPVEIPAAPDPVADKYLPVQVAGTWAGRDIRVLASRKRYGAGYRIVSVLISDEGPVLVDRGFVPVGQEWTADTGNFVTVTGNLHWPDEVDGFTPDPDIDAKLWFARDVDRLAKELETQPILVVAKEISENQVNLAPLPLDTSGIPNDHLQYAVTWFSLAGVWLLMTLYALKFGRRRQSD